MRTDTGRIGSAGPRRAAFVLAACVGGASLAQVPLDGCVRHADIRDEPDSSALVPQPQLDADLEELDSGLGTDAFSPCDERPVGDCQGPVDFPCAFSDLVAAAAADCDQATNCTTNGTLAVRMGADGCVTSIAMDEPNSAIVECLVAAFGAVRCPCTEEKASHFFGLDNAGGCGP